MCDATPGWVSTFSSNSLKQQYEKYIIVSIKMKEWMWLKSDFDL